MHRLEIRSDRVACSTHPPGTHDDPAHQLQAAVTGTLQHPRRRHVLLHGGDQPVYALAVPGFDLGAGALGQLGFQSEHHALAVGVGGGLMGGILLGLITYKIMKSVLKIALQRLKVIS